MATTCVDFGLLLLLLKLRDVASVALGVGLPCMCVHACVLCQWHVCKVEINAEVEHEVHRCVGVHLVAAANVGVVDSLLLFSLFVPICPCGPLFVFDCPSLPSFASTCAYCLFIAPLCPDWFRLVFLGPSLSLFVFDCP